MNDKYVAVPREDWEGILDSVRGKTGKTALLKSGEVKPEIDGIKTGGGSGGGSVPRRYITFFDYDGTIVESWSKADLDKATELPENPTHDGLTSQGWNWTLEQLKAEGGEVDVGQMYVPTDGKTHIFVDIDESCLTVNLGLSLYRKATIDFGDGSTPVTISGGNNKTVSGLHTYASPGGYEITIELDSNATASISGEYQTSTGYTTMSYLLGVLTSLNSHKQNLRALSGIQKVYLGKGVRLSSYAFTKCYSLRYVTLSTDVTNIPAYAFYECHSLEHITIPKSTTQTPSRAFYECRSLKSISLPPKFTSIAEYFCSYCSALPKLNIPKETTTIGNYAFSGCMGLELNLPEGVTSIGSQAFTSQSSLRKFVVPSGVTQIQPYTCGTCYSLTTVVIHSGVTSIGNNAFRECWSLKECYVEAETPPTLGTSVFSGYPSDFKIYVPANSVDAYKSATNWSAFASNIQAKP